MNRTLTRAALPILAVATALTLAACGSSNDAPAGHSGMPGMSSTTPGATTPAGPAASGPHNHADIEFATGMIPHHAQAVTMADLALTRATNASIKDLATAIKAAQDPEIKTMSGWLTGWGQAVPTTGGHNMSQMGSTGGGATGSSTMGGMMTDQEMQRLSVATGVAFDRMWLKMMIQHHQGAVAMSRTELTAGTNPDAKKLAHAIIAGQTKEISTMTGLLPTIRG